MARKLKTYQTSLGFYDLAIAASSMKAALEAWGAGSNLFHQGIANETDDPDVVAATMKSPGVVLKRPAGSSGRFAEHSELPSDLGTEVSCRVRRRPKQKHQAARKISEKVAHKAAVDFEKERKRRQAERKREEAAMAKERARREKAVAKAQAAFDEARQEHETRTGAIEADQAVLEKRAQEEEVRWNTKREKLEAALRRARDWVYRSTAKR
ncbi:colicin import membrane protein [Bradyrhizobium ottawaense]|uniref:cell envelope biogenesis protein TolA n=1 Tax=Bradyrhizobium ottawaense TaxID=931866 RepID=UPI003511DE27